jgi:DNA-binding CsgD family transcriptional regulator
MSVGGSIVGRRPELARIRVLLSQTISGMGGALVVSGEAGIGKTALLQSIATEAKSQFDVRLATGIPSEQGLPYAALHTLLLQEPQDRALISADDTLAAIAGLRNVSTPPLAITVASSLLGHFSNLGEKRPLLLIVDDLQWIDQSSAMALVFAARRLLADRVAVIFGLRTNLISPNNPPQLNDPPPLDLRGFETMVLDLLPDSEGVDLLVSHGVPITTANAVAPRAGGLPLALAELARNFDTGPRGEEPISVNLPVMYLERINQLDPMAKQLCVAAAIDDDFRLLTSIFGVDTNVALERAEEAGVVTLSNGRIRFRHPLLRASALSSISPSEERRLHAAFADALLPHGEHDRIALHRAGAALGIDDSAAQILADFAARAYARGALRESSDALLRASQLTMDRVKRARWTLDAAEMIYNAGDAPGGLAIAERLRETAGDIDLSPKLETLILNASQWDRDPKFTVSRFRVEAQTLAAHDPRRAAWLYAHCSGMAFLSGDLQGGIDDGVRAIALAEQCNEFLPSMLARGNLLWNLFLAADQSREGVEHVAMATIMEMSSHSETIEGVTVAQAVVMMAVMEERWDDADTLLIDSSAASRRLGLRLSTVLFSMVQGALCWRRGRWHEGLVLATQDLADGELPAVALAWGRAAAAQITASLGDVEATKDLASRALGVAHSLRVPLIAAWASAALGQLELGYGRSDLALPYFDQVAVTIREIGMREPGFLMWQGDWIDALIDLNQRAEAEAAISELADAAERTGRGWARGVVARSEARLASVRLHAEERFDDALKEFSVLGMPFELARTLFARAEYRRALRLDHADADYLECGRIFRRLGAVGWIARVDNSSGVSPNVGGAKVAQEVTAVLSSAEMRVALLAAAGRTNKQISTELYVSIKTVEFHLQSIYRKLAVKNRAEFVRSFARSFDATR